MNEIQNSVGKFLDPNLIIAQLGIECGNIVADFGCGPGYFSIPFAKAVGDDGRVYALDILPQTLETVLSQARNSGVSNVVTMRVNLEKENGSKLEPNSVDWVILKDILFQNRKKDIIIKEAHRVLKAGGKAVVVEWGHHESLIGPAHEIRVFHVDCEKMFNDNEFIVEKNIEAGDFHYAFVATKS